MAVDPALDWATQVQTTVPLVNTEYIGEDATARGQNIVIIHDLDQVPFGDGTGPGMNAFGQHDGATVTGRDREHGRAVVATI